MIKAVLLVQDGGYVYPSSCEVRRGLVDLGGSFDVDRSSFRWYWSKRKHGRGLRERADNDGMPDAPK